MRLRPWQAGLAEGDRHSSEYRVLYPAFIELAKEGSMLRTEMVRRLGGREERLEMTNAANLTSNPPPEESARVTFHSRAARWYVANGKLLPPQRWWSG